MIGSSQRALRWALGRYRVRLFIRAVARVAEAARFATVRPRTWHRFHIVSTQRNAGPAIISCLNSVASQRYPLDRYHHLVIDDASSDETVELIDAWCAENPRQPVEFIRRSRRWGGTVNTLDGMERAPSDSIVLELNGDDWFPDPGVLSFLNKVYQDPAVWMTYNTLRESSGVIPFQLPPPREVRRNRSYRSFPWSTSHLHTFRRRLLNHIAEDVLIDPETGEHWASADDVALYLYMLELAGTHAHHIWRITYVYNFHQETEYQRDRQGQLDRAGRIRRQPRAQALVEL